MCNKPCTCKTTEHKVSKLTSTALFHAVLAILSAFICGAMPSIGSHGFALFCGGFSFLNLFISATALTDIDKTVKDKL